MLEGLSKGSEANEASSTSEKNELAGHCEECCCGVGLFEIVSGVMLIEKVLCSLLVTPFIYPS
jgi:hypothetical protein